MLQPTRRDKFRKGGILDPDKVRVPGIYVQRVVKVEKQNYIPTID
jgi:acyl CoA:acetate/3-ketoacid CoA transferase